MSIKKVFNNFEDNSGWRSCERMLEYVEEFESKKNYEIIKKKYDEFKESNCLKKDFYNFRRFCLNN